MKTRPSRRRTEERRDAAAATTRQIEETHAPLGKMMAVHSRTSPRKSAAVHAQKQQQACARAIVARPFFHCLSLTRFHWEGDVYAVVALDSCTQRRVGDTPMATTLRRTRRPEGGGTHARRNRDRTQRKRVRGGGVDDEMRPWRKCRGRDVFIAVARVPTGEATTPSHHARGSTAVMRQPQHADDEGQQTHDGCGRWALSFYSYLL